MEQLFQKVKGLKTQNTSGIDQKADKSFESDDNSSWEEAGINLIKGTDNQIDISKMSHKSIQVELTNTQVPRLNLLDISNEEYDQHHESSTLLKSSGRDLDQTKKAQNMNKVKIRYKKFEEKKEDWSSVSSKYIKPELTSSDRRNIKKCKKYEHRFRKTGDTISHYSPPKDSLESDHFSDYISKNTKYYENGGSPQPRKNMSFSPVLNRMGSFPRMNCIELKKIEDKKNDDSKRYVALSGKLLDFKIQK